MCVCVRGDSLVGGMTENGAAAALRCKTERIVPYVRRTQWKSNPGDLWEPHRYDPTIAIHMDKLIQDGAFCITDCITIRNDAAFGSVNPIWIAVRLSQCLFYERDYQSWPGGLPPSYIHIHASCVNLPLPFSIPPYGNMNICLIVRETASCGLKKIDGLSNLISY